MLRIFKTLRGYVEVSGPEQGCWVNVTQPKPEEISYLKSEFHVPEDIIRDILDADERPRFEYDDDWSLILMRIPIQSLNNGIPYFTVPLGIYMTEHFTITICSELNEVLSIDSPSLYRENQYNAGDMLNFVFRLFLRSGTIYLNYLKQINHQSAQVELELQKSARNEDLHKLLKIEKCLVYFITSLKANENVLTRIRNSNKKSMTEINEDLLEDAFIENKQALDMAQIYSDIQSDLKETFSSFISNNLNVAMKRLTSISIVMMIPTLIASIYGMNVPNYLEHKHFAFPGIIIGAGLLAFVVIMIFRKLRWF
jgi:magnesium transporter